VFAHDAEGYSTGLSAFRTLWREEGLRGLYAGLGASIWLSGLASGVWWGSYESIKGAMTGLTGVHSADRQSSAVVVVQMASGVLAGALTGTVINPLDIVKTRIQTQANALKTPAPAAAAATATTATAASTVAAASAAAAAPPVHIRHTLHGLQLLVREEGWRALAKGLFPKLVSRAPFSAVSTALYELTLTWSQKTDK
jgi:hypothetical protein